MKKVLIATFSTLFAFNVCADTTAETNVEAEVAAEDSAALDGFYLGGGFGLWDGGVRTETTAAPNASEIGVDTNDHATELMLSLVAGWGKTFNQKFYFGIEGGADFSRNNNFHHEGIVNSGTNKSFGVSSRINGIIPMIALRFGYSACNTITYLKAGAFWTKAKAQYVDFDANNVPFSGEGSVSKLTPFVALGWEKVINSCWRGRTEFEYRIRTHKNFKYTRGDGECAVKVENKDAFAFRAYVVRSFSFGR